jgi:hypothetical protein
VAIKPHWKVRPYVLTGGRTRTRTHLLVHTLVSVPRYDTLYAASLPPEARELYVTAGRRMCSVAELSARCGMPLGVTRVVIDDLANGDRLVIHPDHARPAHNLALLGRLRDGLRNLA